jgi:hypothetical protein
MANTTVARKNPRLRLIAFGLLTFVVLVGIPLTIYLVGKQQQVTQHAAWSVPQTQTYFCNNNLSVNLIISNENPSCPTGYIRDGSLKSFQSSVILQASSNSTGEYTVFWDWAQFWCPVEDQHLPCTQNSSDHPKNSGLTGHGGGADTLILTSDVKTPASPFNGLACGYYQNDFGFYIVDHNDSTQAHLCSHNIVLDTSHLQNTNNNASWCHTGVVSCAVPGGTPTPTVTPVPTL